MKVDSDVVRYLVDELGSTLVAALSGSTDRKVAQKWLAGEVEPSSDEQLRLESAYEYFQDVAKNEGTDIARAWFIGTNVRNGLSPWSAIRDGDIEGVRISAQHQINDTGGY